MDRPLTALFIDCDSYFASVEQHLDPSLQGKAVGVAPVMAETSCCIAASYEAKALGVKTGTRISDARIMCPGIRIVEAKPSEYVRFHHRVIAAVEDCTHVEAVLSIDEMWSWLPLNLRKTSDVERIARSIKATIARDVSPVIKVSIGVGPNKYLAKLASKMRKPDGLFILESHELPDVLHELKLSDFTGIGRKMETRLHAAGIHTAEDLCSAPMQRLHAVWGGVLGDRLWHLLRGVEIPDLVSAQKSIGHSNVLAPECRVPDAAWPILCKLTHKASERMRSHGLLTGSLLIKIGYLGGPSWSAETRFTETDCTTFLMDQLRRIWKDRPDPRSLLIQIAVVLSRLVAKSNYTPELFVDQVAEAMASTDEKRRSLDAALDALRSRYGRDVVYFGSVHEARNQAPMRISFTHIPDLKLESDRTL